MLETSSLTDAQRLAIMDLLARYTWCLDARDAVGFAALFAPQGVWQPSTELGVVDQREDRDRFAARLGGQSRNLRHIATTPIIEGNAERCEARSLCQVVVEVPGEPVATTQVAEYYDTCVKVEGRWLLEHKLVKTVLEGRHP